jgi:hypothetical protein
LQLTRKPKSSPHGCSGIALPSAQADFISDVAGRLKSRIQLTSDGLRIYLNAVEQAFGADIDYAMLVKMYTNDHTEETRYSPAECTGTRTVRVMGTPDERHISTSYVERQNLTVRTTNRRYTRLTSAFSKKIENHAASVALGYFAYNIIKIHRTLRTSPAMAAGVTNRLWEVSDLVALCAVWVFRFTPWKLRLTRSASGFTIQNFSPPPK